MSNYAESTVTAAEMFKALGNPHRARVFQRLLSCCAPGTVCSIDAVESSCVSDLGADLGIAASTLSHHIKELSRAGLIVLQRRGRYVDCQVNPRAVEALAGFFDPGRDARRNQRRKQRS